MTPRPPSRPAPLAPPPDGGFVRLVGVDQTGAATRGGRAAKPLPVVTLGWADGWRLRAAEDDRTACTWSALTAAAAGAGTLVLLDAVQGLPAAAWDSAGLADGGAGLRTLWGCAAAWPGDARGRVHGRAAGSAFFEALRGPGPEARRADVVSGALPVFRHVPFQRNVQTGTYRVWRELGAEPNAWRVWPFDGDPRPGARPWLVEAWPSLGWRRVLGRSTRAPEMLPRMLEALGVRATPADLRVLVESADHADAAVNAVMGAWLQGRGELARPWPGFAPDRREGWIAGLVPPDGDVATGSA